LRDWRNATAKLWQGAQASPHLARRDGEIMFGWFRKNAREDALLAFYRRVAEASRSPSIYIDLKVPDTVEGRLESLSLHALLVMRRLGELPAPADEVSQGFVDVLFQHIDHGLRELGVGDVVMGKRMKKIAQNFYGRMKAYAPGLDAGDAALLSEALARNVPGAEASALAAAALHWQAALSRQSLDEMLTAAEPFAPADMSAAS
jgi:cytochrome b pre-mRNA-processing protein 3